MAADQRVDVFGQWVDLLDLVIERVGDVELISNSRHVERVLQPGHGSAPVGIPKVEEPALAGLTDEGGRATVWSPS